MSEDEKFIIVWSGSQPLTPDYEQHDRNIYPAQINPRAMRGLTPGSDTKGEDDVVKSERK
jgi:hypothetical protein